MAKNRDTKNAKEEFLEITKDCKVIAATISFDEYYTDADEKLSFQLNPLYNQEEYEKFLKFLDRDYNSGYGGQELFGYIFCEDNIWMERGEYDGAEWWEKHQYPNLRDHFNNTIVLKYERSTKLKRIEKNN